MIFQPYRKRRENSRFWKQGIIIAKIKGYGKKKYIPERYLSVSLLTLFYKRFGSVVNVPILEFLTKLIPNTTRITKRVVSL